MINQRLTWAVVAVFAVLAATVWYVQFRDKGDTQAATASTADLQIFKFEANDARLLEVSKTDQKFTAQKDEQGEWTLLPSSQPGDKLRISSVLTRLASLQALRKVADSTTELSQYGLSNPALTASVTLTDGTVYALQAGARTPTDSNTYVKRATDDTVFLVQNQIVADLERLITDPPIVRATPTPAPIPSPPAIPSPSPSPTS